MTDNDKPIPGMEAVDIQREMPAKAVVVEGALTKEELQYLVAPEVASSRALRITGIVISLLGIVIIVLGYSGAINFQITMPGLSSKLANASPGIVILIVGLVLLLASRVNIKVKVTTSARNTPDKGK